MNALELTDSAITRITEILNEDGEAIALRIGVKPSGCTGYEYTFALEYDMQQGDILVSYKSAAIITDKATNNLLQDATLDYVNTFGGAKFVINNPNEGNRCGCGKSFNIGEIKIEPK